MKKKCLLIFDKAPSHIDIEILAKIKINNTYWIFVPGGLTRYLQPLDIGVNKVFKEALKKEYLYLENLNKTEKVDLKKKKQYYKFS